MSGKPDPSDMRALYERLDAEASQGGYNLNPDESFTMGLMEGLLVNQDRYGYPACPCRLASGDPDEDRDIVCPCDYRDQDLSEFGACYCALYVSDAVARGEALPNPIPERRPLKEKRGKGQGERDKERAVSGLAYPVWRCRVCGYLCAREGPPDTCPICKAKKDRFERFI